MQKLLRKQSARHWYHKLVYTHAVGNGYGTVIPHKRECRTYGTPVYSIISDYSAAGALSSSHTKLSTMLLATSKTSSEPEKLVA